MRIGGGNISKKDEIFEFLQVFFRPFFLLCGGRFKPRRLIRSIHDLEMNRRKKKNTGEEEFGESGGGGRVVGSTGSRGMSSSLE